MTKGKSIIGIMASLIALSACSEMTECAMGTKPVPPAVSKVPEKIFCCPIEQYLAENVRYPDDCGDTCVQGRVIVSFVVERDGRITEAKVVKSVYQSLDEEALRVVSGMPKWAPGKLNGEAIRTKYVIPITFKVE